MTWQQNFPGCNCAGMSDIWRRGVQIAKGKTRFFTRRGGSGTPSRRFAPFFIAHALPKMPICTSFVHCLYASKATKRCNGLIVNDNAENKSVDSG